MLFIYLFILNLFVKYLFKTGEDIYQVNIYVSNFVVNVMQIVNEVRVLNVIAKKMMSQPKRYQEYYTENSTD